MIRPYVAILKDSFREAMASRVLWMALICIAVVLLALTPVGLRTDRSTRLRQRELTGPEGLARSLREGSGAPDTPAGHLWTLLSSEQQGQIQEWLSETATAEPQPPRPGRRGRSVRSQLVSLMNGLLQKPDFHRSPTWKQLSLDPELESQVVLEDLPEADASARNLKLLAAAFPKFIQLQDAPAISITYAGTDMIGPIDALPAQFERLLDQVILGVLSVFLGFFGVFGSLLVTATVIPRTYEPGEISLLLSKPVSRSLLFLTKFLGGCAFTLLCAALLVTGIWLLLGTRLHFWRHELLWCIPIYVFLFAVYFSVSALAGLIWRNAVVSLVVVVMFWIVLFTVGATQTLLDENIIKSRALIEIAVAGDEVFAVQGSRSMVRWDAEKQDWSEVFARQDQGVPQFLQRLVMSGIRIRPVYDVPGQRLLVLQPEPSRFGGPGAATVVSGNAEGNWERETEGRTPDSVYCLFIDSTGRVILPGPGAIYEFAGLNDQQKQAQQLLGNWLGGILRPSASQAFRPLHPKEMPVWSPEAAVAMDGLDDTLVVCSNSTVQRLDRTSDGRYSLGPQRQLPDQESAVVAVGGRFILVAFGNGHVLILDKTTLETIAEKSLPARAVPRVAEAAGDGSRFAVLTHEGDLTIFDGTTASFSEWAPTEQGHASAVAFDHDHRLWVADGRRGLSAYPRDSSGPAESRAGAQDWVYRVYDLAIRPLHTILPKPSDMDNAVTWLITGERSVATGPSEGGSGGGMNRDNLQSDRIVLDVWTPVWSNLAFIVVVLGTGCLYVAYRDF